ncbi:hypothetical protein ASG12_18765 [Williamsia sp. Leaf354]|nr:hypothetical protein ASG12_18765 [Williamsia sp. Leaf354]
MGATDAFSRCAVEFTVEVAVRSHQPQFRVCGDSYQVPSIQKVDDALVLHKVSYKQDNSAFLRDVE